jgi:hypothetical protein
VGANKGINISLARHLMIDRTRRVGIIPDFRQGNIRNIAVVSCGSYASQGEPWTQSITDTSHHMSRSANG